MTNCVNCGAVLTGKKCEYCGTEYREENLIVAKFSKNGMVGKLKINDDEYDVYIGGIEHNAIALSSGRDCNGKLHVGETCVKRKFTLIEM